MPDKFNNTAPVPNAGFVQFSGKFMVINLTIRFEDRIDGGSNRPCRWEVDFADGFGATVTARYVSKPPMWDEWGDSIGTDARFDLPL